MLANWSRESSWSWVRVEVVRALVVLGVLQQAGAFGMALGALVCGWHWMPQALGAGRMQGVAPTELPRAASDIAWHLVPGACRIALACSLGGTLGGERCAGPMDRVQGGP